jgi:hypothetical protein
MGLIRYIAPIAGFLFAILILDPYLDQSPWLEFVLGLVLILIFTLLAVRRRERKLDDELRKRWPELSATIAQEGEPILRGYRGMST